MNVKLTHMIAFLLVIVGGLNLGFMGFFEFNVIKLILGSIPIFENITYVLMGLSALYLLYAHKKDCRICGK